jgi:hypothetical protein
MFSPISSSSDHLYSNTQNSSRKGSVTIAGKGRTLLETNNLSITASKLSQGIFAFSLSLVFRVLSFSLSRLCILYYFFLQIFSFDFYSVANPKQITIIKKQNSKVEFSLPDINQAGAPQIIRLMEQHMRILFQLSR